MGQGVIQIAAIDEENLYFVHNPDITFFKTVIRKTNNMSIEPVPQPFNIAPNFGDKVSCDVARNVGDALHKMYLVVDLPDIVQQSGVLYAWKRYVGYELIDFVEVEINGKVVDRQYGDWMRVMEEMENDFEFKRVRDMVGDVEELYEYSATKRSRRLYVPLKFWFNYHASSALPLLALQYSEVKIYVQFKALDQCLFTAPTHSIVTREFLSLYTPFELLHQVRSDGVEVFGRFITFDETRHTVRYVPIYSTTFEANTPITGLQSAFTMTPTAATVAAPPPLPTLSIKRSYLLCNFFYLENEERMILAKRPQRKLIRALQVFREANVVNRVRRFKINFNHPCATLFVFAQRRTATPATTYTTFIEDGYNDISTASLIRNLSLVINGKPYTTETSSDIFNKLNKFVYYERRGSNGVHVLVLDLSPSTAATQPSGSINCSVNASVELECTFDPVVDADNPVDFSCYALHYNVLLIENGIGELEFTN